MRPRYRRIRRSCYALLLSAAGLLLGAVPARPQALPDSGQLVRVQLQNARKVVGKVVRFGRDTLVLSVSTDNGRRLFAFPRSDLAQTWVSVGHTHHALQGAGIGLLAGSVLGGVIGAATYQPCEFLECLIAPRSRTGAAVLGGALGALPGLVIGAIVGAANARQDWQPVDLPTTVSVVPGRRALGLTVRLSL